VLLRVFRLLLLLVGLVESAADEQHVEVVVVAVGEPGGQVEP
jgi:hypothetical protein